MTNRIYVLGILLFFSSVCYSQTYFYYDRIDVQNSHFDLEEIQKFKGVIILNEIDNKTIITVRMGEFTAVCHPQTIRTEITGNTKKIYYYGLLPRTVDRAVGNGYLCFTYDLKSKKDKPEYIIYSTDNTDEIISYIMAD